MRALWALVLLAAGCSGEEPPRLADGQATCEKISKLARSIMTARQEGIDMAQMMHPGGEEASDAARTLVLAAYDLPRYSSPEYVQRASDDFANDAYLACIK